MDSVNQLHTIVSKYNKFQVVKDLSKFLKKLPYGESEDRTKINKYLERLHYFRDQKEDDELAYNIKNILHQSFAFENNWIKSYQYMYYKNEVQSQEDDFDEYCKEMNIEKNSSEYYKEYVLLYTKFKNIKDFVINNIE